MSRNRRKSKQLSEEEILEMEAFLNRNNVEEEKVFKTITINVKCKTDNQKKLIIDRIKLTERHSHTYFTGHRGKK